MKVLFVCTGNICRSPAAEAVMRKMRAQWTIDSAGIGAWHAGEPSDPRAAAAAAKRGYDMRNITARGIRDNDWTDFDRIYAMTKEHLDFMRAHAPADATADIRMFLQNGEEVPDPYYGGDDGFELMMDLLEKRCREIAAETD